MIGVLSALALAASNPALEPLMPQCRSTVADGCGDFAKRVWKRFESETGEVTKLDTLSIRPLGGGIVMATIYSFTPGSSFDPRRLRTLQFTCKGQYRDPEYSSNFLDAPPRSLIGMIADTACRVAEPMRLVMLQQERQRDSIAHERAMHPRPEDYCVGFSVESCKIIQRGVDARIDPSYCKDGYGLPGSGLSDEQIRICSARPPKANQQGLSHN
jgi:hypothetical protein